MKLSVFLLLAVVVVPAFGQQTQNGSADQNNSGYFNPFTLAGGMLEHNFVNVFAYGDGAYDSNAQVLTNGQTGGSFGYGLGGGIQLSHVWRDAQLGLSYSGGYQHYRSNFFISGPTQNLSLGYSKRLARRWTLSLTEGAGIYRYGQTYYSSQATNTTPIVANPFSPEVKFASSGFGLTYQQTRRLSYTLSGYFSLYRYSGGGNGIGADDAGGSLALDYRLTARTTVGATYSYNYFLYQRNAGTDRIHGIYATLSHQFKNHWTAFLSAGVARSSAAGTLAVPVTIITGQQQPLTGYVLGSYHDVSDIPSFSGSLTHNYRHSQFSVNAGQGVSSGNGVFLASKNRFVGGVYSYGMRDSVLSVAGYYNRLSSVSNTIASNYSSGSFTISYGHNLTKYVAGNVRYDYIEYGGLGSYQSAHDNHITFGLSFSSKNIPLTLF